MPDISAEPATAGNVLLAEDHPVNRRIGTAILENLGFDVDVVADGAEAVKAATRTPYLVIFMDCQLPVLDGFAASAAIRSQESSTRRTPIIAVTASSTEADRRRSVAAGMDDYLTKPLSLEMMRAVLDRWAPDGSNVAIAVDAEGDVPATDAGSTEAAEQVHPVLDVQVLDRLERLGAAVGEDLMGQLTTMFFLDAEASVVALREALARNDLVAVNRSAHSLSGASANLGATDLARMCATMAKDGASGELLGGRALFDAIEAELDRVRSALRPRISTP